MQDLVKDLRRGFEGIDYGNAFRRVILEHLGGIALVHCQPMANDMCIGIVRTALLYRAVAQPLNHRFDIITPQMKNLDDHNVRVQQCGLPDGARDAIQDEYVGRRVVHSSGDPGCEVVQAERDRQIVRDQVAA